MDKRAYRMCFGYLIGAAGVGVDLIARGDGVKVVLKLLALWLPIGAVYLVASYFALSRMRLAMLGGMLELCGICIGVMPLLSGVWPTYWMRWNLALVIIAWQCSVLALAICGRWLLQRLISARDGQADSN